MYVLTQCPVREDVKQLHRTRGEPHDTQAHTLHNVPTHAHMPLYPHSCPHDCTTMSTCTPLSTSGGGGGDVFNVWWLRFIDMSTLLNYEGRTHLLCA